MWLAKNISYDEMIFSQTAARLGICNAPAPDIVHNLEKTALALQVIRAYFDKPVIISSGYRSKELNEAIEGSKNSHHMLGYAVDFVIPGIKIEDIIKVIPKLICFDQVINEYDKWVHLSIHPSLRHEILKF